MQERDTATWEELRRAAPDLAAAGVERFDRTGLVLVGSIRSDGYPRISPVEPVITDGDLYLGMMYRSTKALDLHRDPRCVVHNTVADKDGTDGEVKVYGRARSIDDPDERERYGIALFDKIGWRPEGDFDLFAVDIEQVAFVVFANDKQRRRHLRPLDHARHRHLRPLRDDRHRSCPAQRGPDRRERDRLRHRPVRRAVGPSLLPHREPVVGRSRKQLISPAATTGASVRQGWPGKTEISRRDQVSPLVWSFMVGRAPADVWAPERGVVLDEALQQFHQFPALGGGEGFEQRVLGGVDPAVEPTKGS